MWILIFEKLTNIRVIIQIQYVSEYLDWRSSVATVASRSEATSGQAHGAK